MKVLFPGSFDPFTIGHADIVKRTLAFADEVVIAIGVHPLKHGATTPEQRKAQIEETYKKEPRVTVEIYQGLTTDFAKRLGIGVIVRGVRNTVDFEYEKNIAEVNRQLTGVETILLFSDPKYAAVSSSVVRELESYGKDIHTFLP